VRALLCLLVLCVAACGSEDKTGAPMTPTPAVATAKPAVVEEPAQLEVEVRGERNQPLADALLTLTEVFQGSVRRAQANAQGLARWEAVPPGHYELALVPSAEQQQQLLQSSGADQSLWQHINPRKSLELEAGMRLKVVLGGASADATRVLGRLLRGGQAAPGVLVIARTLTGEEREFARTLSQADGSFELLLAPGLYDFTLQHSLGAASLTRRVRIARAAEQVLEFELSGGLLRGRLLDSRGAPLAGRRVELQLLSIGGVPATDLVQPARISGEDGAFLFRDLPPGIYRLAAGESALALDPEAPRLARVVTRELKLPLPEEQPFDLVLQPGRSLRGLLHGADTGARVMVHDSKGEQIAMVVCERDPRLPEGTVEFRIDDLPSGPLRARAEYRSLASPLSEAVRLDDPDPMLLELRLEAAQMLLVDIVSEGAPPRVVQVELQSADGSRVEHRELRAIAGEPASLRAYFNGLLPGRWVLSARDEQGRRAAMDHESTRPGSQMLQLELRRE